MNDTSFRDTLAQAKLPGATAMIVDREGVRYSHASGERNAVEHKPMALDTPCQIASMTKAIVSVGAMQLVEQGKLELDAPIGSVLPELAAPQVLEGFAEDGSPKLRPAEKPVTLRHLLTHTAGLGYFFVQPEVLRYFAHAGMPAPGTKASLQMPLMFEPGEKWEYSVATDWAGLAIEAATGQKLRDYLSENIFQPLGMENTGFHDAPLPEGAAIHRREGDGFVTAEMFLGGGEFDSGGGGLISTAPDYGRFLRMILRGGELDGARILTEESVAEMSRNQIGDIRAGYMGSAMPDLAAPYDTFPDQHTGWGLGFLINPERGPAGRSPGSLAWAGIFNSYYWIDPSEDVAGVFISQMAPFGDPGALESFAALERMAYA